MTLDGEAVVLGADGNTDFAALQASMQDGARHPLTFFAFDLLHLNGRNPRGLPLLERKHLLEQLLQQAGSTLQFCEHLVSNGRTMFSKACELHAEGIVSKRADSPYRGGRGPTWLKAKCLHSQEFVIGGYTLPGAGKAGGPGIGALLLGVYDDDAHLIFAGKTGTGFTERLSAQIRKKLETIARAKSPFQALPGEARRGALFVEPKLVAQVRFANWTADGQVRQAAFLGLREDKPASQVRREHAAPTPKSSRPFHAPAAPGAPAAPAAPAAQPQAPVRLTHPEKVLDPASGMTKQQLADFYWAVSERMLPHVAGRALSLVRLPTGVGKPSFYQKHVTTALPSGFGSFEISDKTGAVEPYITLATREAVASLAQMATLEIHPWGSRTDDLERPDRLVLDLDPDEALPWPALTAAALDARKQLKQLGLASWVKTTGGKGLHVVVPIQPELEWPEIKTFCHGFALRMEKSNPKLYLTKMTKAARARRIYLDYLRNERGATAVAPYSPRARPGVGVAMPLAWTELKQADRPHFSVGNFPEWAARLKKDPWKALLTTRQRISGAALRECGVR